MRLFFAVPVDTQTVRVLASVQEHLKQQFRHSKVSWVAPENFHITMHFLGEGDNETIAELLLQMRTCHFPESFKTIVRGVDAFPSKKDPKTVLAQVEIHPSLFGVYKRIGDVIASLGFDIDERPFRPHITLGRVRSRAEVLKPELIELETEFLADRVVLFKSELTAQGSIYTELESFAFK